MQFWNGNKWVGDTPPLASKRESRVKRVAAAALEASLITALTFGLIAGTAFAARGGKGASGTTGGGKISLVLLNGATEPSFGAQVTFNVTATFSQPWVNLNCYQNGTWASGEWGGFFAGSAYDQTFTLGPSNSWAGGDADCKADLVQWTAKGSLVVKASTSFHVYA
jgi:hypothetical protein